MKKHLRKTKPLKPEQTNDNLLSWKKVKSKILNAKSKLVSVYGAVIGTAIFIFILLTYKSPADVKCAIDFVQRPDSIFQAQLYIWNDGGNTAENVIFWAKKEEVFFMILRGIIKTVA